MTFFKAERQCNECNATFTPWQYNQKRCEICIQKDPRHDPSKLFRVCKGCGGDFRKSAPQQYYCTPECKADNHLLLANHGITRKDWNKMYEDQGGTCAICDGEGFVMRKSKYTDYTLCVDHCHETGKIRGLLCHNCNRALGLLQDSADSLKKAIKYLSESATTIVKTSTAKQREAQGKGLKGNKNTLTYKGT